MDAILINYDSDVIILPADDKTARKVYIKPIFSKFGLEVLRCDNQFPYGHEILVEDYAKGLASLRVGPIPNNAPKRTYNIRIIDYYSFTAKDIPVTIV